MARTMSNAPDIIQTLMRETGTTQAMMGEYADMGGKSNISRLLAASDMKTGTFVRMLEVLGYELVVRSTEICGDEQQVEYYG